MLCVIKKQLIKNQEWKLPKIFGIYANDIINNTQLPTSKLNIVQKLHYDFIFSLHRQKLAVGTKLYLNIKVDNKGKHIKNFIG